MNYSVHTTTLVHSSNHEMVESTWNDYVINHAHRQAECSSQNLAVHEVRLTVVSNESKDSRISSPVVRPSRRSKHLPFGLIAERREAYASSISYILRDCVSCNACLYKILVSWLSRGSIQ